VPLPGTTHVLNRSSNVLEPCSPERCPSATETALDPVTGGWVVVRALGRMVRGLLGHKEGLVPWLFGSGAGRWQRFGIRPNGRGPRFRSRVFEAGRGLTVDRKVALFLSRPSRPIATHRATLATHRDPVGPPGHLVCQAITPKNETLDGRRCVLNHETVKGGAVASRRQLLTRR
jgi:hypothetical protein